MHTPPSGCRWHRLLGCVAVAIAAAACGPGQDQAAESERGHPSLAGVDGPYSATATMDQGVRAVPSTTTAGERVELWFEDEDKDRGVGWALEQRTTDGWRHAFTLVADSDHYGGDAPRWSAETAIDIDDVGVAGLGPDVVVLPPDLEPGPWRLCHMGGESNVFCTELTVTE